ncbi:isochorismate-pyruvate lyase [Vogesella sp. EB]|uniref:chorismate mutase n=1 Tax=Vogesella sp. EB TaxID=1526735 RepID=UPI00064D578C|nr:chorismate mutase [Vogesella sp. EB]KMJ52521.1 isochorismate-pyruvate lyase [Vogesella sp. EB]
MSAPRLPAQCRDMAEIRGEIDRIDQQVIALLGERFRYVKAATAFKHSADTVRAKARFDSMLAQRRVWAEQQQLSADVIERLYRELVNYFIAEELAAWQVQQPASG